MIQVYADGVLIYDSRMEEMALLELTAKLGLNKSGTVTIKMPKDHPAHGAFVPRRTVVEIYRDKVLFFRGRALYETDDFFLRRTVTCEGERGFFRDGIMQPGTYEGTPAAIFSAVVTQYNLQVEEFKQFLAKDVNVEALNANGDYDATATISITIDDAESCAEMIDRLVERCSGYITFATNALNQRVVNWVTELDVRSTKVIEYGENLLDFTRTGADADIVTMIVPYGAKNETTGTRISIADEGAYDYSEGKYYIKDKDMADKYGTIARAVYWDDITDPVLLYHKASQYLYSLRNRVTTIELTAFDLSLIDKSIDRFHLGDMIRVKSKPHEVDADFRLEEQTIDFLHPQNDKVVLGKSTSSLTRTGAAEARMTAYNLQTLEQTVRADYTVNQPAIVEETKLALASLIQQTSEAIMLEVAEQFATNSNVENAIKTTMTQLADSFEFLFYQLETRVDANDIQARTQFTEIAKYIRFVDGNIILGEQGNEITLRIENDRLSFLDDGAEVAYFSNKKLTVLDGSFLHSLKIGSFQFLPRENGNLSLVKVGG